MATNIEMDEATYEDVNDTEFHDAIMRAWYAFDKYYSLTDELCGSLAPPSFKAKALY